MVSRALLEGWLTQLHEAGLTPECLYADSSLTPENPGQAVLVLNDDNVVLRALDHLGVERQNVAVATDQAVQDPKSVPKTDELFERQNVISKKGGASIAYYAGAVMVLFSLFAAFKPLVAAVTHCDIIVAPPWRAWLVHHRRTCVSKSSPRWARARSR